MINLYIYLSMYLFDFDVQRQPWPEAWSFQVVPWHNVSRTPWGKLGTNVHWDSRLNWLDFGGQRLRSLRCHKMKLWDLLYKQVGGYILRKGVSHSSGTATWLAHGGIQPQGRDTSLFVCLYGIHNLTEMMSHLVSNKVKESCAFLWWWHGTISLNSVLCRATLVLQFLLSGPNG